MHVHARTYTPTVNLGEGNLEGKWRGVGSNRRLDNSPELMFCALWLISLRCLIWILRYVNKEKCILLADMQHLQPHISLYRAVIFLSCGGDILRKVESMMMILYSAYLASFSTPYSGEITMLFCSYINDTLNNNFETNCGPFCPYIDNLRQSLAIGDCTTWGWCRIHI